MHLVEQLHGFVESARGDWLHPQFGPFPDFVGVFDDDDDDRFKVAVWINRTPRLPQYVVFVEFVEASDEAVKDVWHKGVPQTYRWKQYTGTTMYCKVGRNTYVKIDTPHDLQGFAEATAKLYKQY